MKNKQVIQSWKNGLPAGSDSSNLVTDGEDLFSYDLLIGFTGDDGHKYVYNYTAQTERDREGDLVVGKYVSQTTSVHVGLAGTVGYMVEPPDSSRIGKWDYRLNEEEDDDDDDGWDEEYEDDEDYDENPSTGTTGEIILGCIKRYGPICAWDLSMTYEMSEPLIKDILRDLVREGEIEEDIDECRECGELEWCYFIEDE